MQHAINCANECQNSYPLWTSIDNTVSSNPRPTFTDDIVIKMYLWQDMEQNFSLKKNV